MIAKRWPDTLEQIDDYTIYLINAHFDEDKKQAQLQQQLLQALFDANWKDKNGEPGTLWRDLARMLLEQGNISEAKAVAARVTYARIALAMRVDKDFDPITRDNKDQYDIDRRFAEEIAAARAKAMATPGKLEPIANLEALLNDTLQFEQVVAISDDIIAKHKNGTLPEYKDFDDQYIWILDQRAYALKRLGRWDEATEQLERAARRPEDGVMNASQIINLGLLYAELGQPDKALGVIDDMGPVTGYGSMQLKMVRLMAAVEKQDKPAIASELADMRTHRTDAIGTWEHALLMTNDMDGAANLVIERLNNPNWRSDVIADVQQYAKGQEAPIESQIEKKWSTVLARPDVLNALAKYCRIEHFNVGRARD